MNRYIYFDCCFFEFCNLTCTYCRTSNDSYEKDIPRERVDAVVQHFLSDSRAAIFKVSGYGEASLWRPLAQFLPQYESYFPTLQVITNGTLKDSLYEELKPISNLIFCLTLDGDTLAANSLRTNSKPRLHESMLRFARKVAVADDRPLELNCVITAQNLPQFENFVRFVKNELGPRAMLMPFPVHPFAGLASTALPATADASARVWEDVQRIFDDCSEVLPPLAYLQRVFEMPGRARRPWRCSVPAFNFAVGPDLEARACACLGHTKPSSDVSNRWGTGIDTNAGTDATHSARELARINQARKGFVDARCGDCLTHYDVVNLFLEGSITWQELQRVPSFSQRGVEEHVRSVAALIGAHIHFGKPPPRGLPMFDASVAGDP